MTRKVLNTVTSAAISDVIKVTSNQADGYANISSQGSSSWFNWSGWWSGQFDQSKYVTIVNANNYLKCTFQISTDHGDTWRSMVNRLLYNNQRNGNGGTWISLGVCGSTNFISGYSTSGDMAIARCVFRPKDVISGLSDGERVYFTVDGRKQDGGGTNYVNNMHINTESASNGYAYRGGFAVYFEEVPESAVSNNWNG